MMRASIVRRIEFDAGHRVPDHAGKCRNPHGHRYVLEAHIAGPIAADGMVLDFGILKQIMVEQIHDLFDHRFIVAEWDTDLLDGLAPFEDAVTVVPFPPTAEHLAQFIHDRLVDALPDPFEVRRVVLWETPNGRAEYPT